MPKNRCRPFTSEGVGKLSIASMFFGRGVTPSASTLWPRNLRDVAAKTHFAGFSWSPFSAITVRNWRRWAQCSSREALAIKLSSKYVNTKGRRRKRRSMRRWKVWAAFFKPNGMNTYSNSPKGVIIAVLGMSASAMGTWWYPLTKSMHEKYLQPESLAEKSSREGRGYLSSTVDVLRRR